MHVRRILVALAAAAAGTVLASPAHAGPYQPGGTAPTISAPTTVQASVPFTVTGSGFWPGEPVTLTIEVTVTGASFERSAPRLIPAAFVPVARAQTETATALPDGSFTKSVTVAQTGSISISARGNLSQSTTMQAVTVVPAQPAVAT